MDLGETVALEQALSHRASSAARAVEHDFGVFCAELTHSTGKLLDRDVDRAAEAAILVFALGPHVDEEGATRHQRPGLGAWNSNGGELQVQDGDDQDGNHREDHFREHRAKDSRQAPLDKPR